MASDELAASRTEKCPCEQGVIIISKWVPTHGYATDNYTTSHRLECSACEATYTIDLLSHYLVKRSEQGRLKELEALAKKQRERVTAQLNDKYPYLRDTDLTAEQKWAKAWVKDSNIEREIRCLQQIDEDVRQFETTMYKQRLPRF